jgi:hypothetical protein
MKEDAEKFFREGWLVCVGGYVGFRHDHSIVESIFYGLMV